MIICKRCNKENQDQHKFCLRCGGELAPPAAAGSAVGAMAMAKTMMADPAQIPQRPYPTPASGVPTQAAGPFSANMPATPFSPPSPLSNMAPVSLPGMPSPHAPHSQSRSATPVGGMPTPSPQILASAAQRPLASAVPQATAASGMTSAPPSAAPIAPPMVPAAAAAGRACPTCGFDVPANFAFCGACGHKLGILPVPGPAARTGTTAPSTPQVEPRPRGILTLIRPDGSEGGTHEVEEGVNKIGRTHGAIFENDGYLSPLHAEVIVNAAGAVVRDLDSLNGVFVKMTAEEELQPGDVFRIGQELIRFDTIVPPSPLEDGTEIMGSPNPGYWGRLSVIIGKDVDGSAFPLLGDAATLGRERGDINFPDDGYVSGLHARMSTRAGKYYVSDMGSSNGTFVRIRGDRQVPNGSFILFGQQLFRLTLTVG